MVYRMIFFTSTIEHITSQLLYIDWIRKIRVRKLIFYCHVNGLLRKAAHRCMYTRCLGSRPKYQYLKKDCKDLDNLLR